MSFANYKTKFKAIAFYYPENNYISYHKYFNKSLNNNYMEQEDIYKLITEQILLASKHGIYGFAIYYNLLESDYVSNITTNLFIYKINFPFFLVCRNIDKINISENDTGTMIINLKKFIINDNYIKINNKPVLSIENPNKLGNINIMIFLFRKILKKIVGDIFLLYPFTGSFSEKKFLYQFDAIYDFSNLDLFEVGEYKHNILYYSGVIYKNLILNQLSIDMPLYRTCYLNYNDFNDYTPEKFYMANNIILEKEKNNLNQNKGIIFIDSWNNYKKGNYLEFNEKYGYSSINTFSKSIFNISFNDNKLKFNCNTVNIIAIHIHLFYEDILMKIINRLNFLPIKYDLFISTVSKEKKNFIEKCLNKTNANKLEIKIFNNKGRDIYPFIEQMKVVFKYYKYICHLHSKKSVHNLFLGSGWSEYLYSNLIGNKEIIFDILNDFEINEKLGFIFPETYYEIKKYYKNFDNLNLGVHSKNKNYMNFIIKKSFNAYKLEKKLIFPVGNMFWAKTKAIYQIFKLRLKYPKELNQTNETIMHAIERIWLYLVKLNGYYYKTIFKHY